MNDLVDIRVRLQTAFMALSSAEATAESIGDALPPDIVERIASARRACATLIARLTHLEDLARDGRS